MKRGRFAEEQSIVIVREQAAGSSTAEVCRKYGVSSATFYKHRATYGGMDASQRLASLWFESIHPFEDGNGHLGRPITGKFLALGLDAPAITTLAETIQHHRTDDYAQLQRASLSNQINEGAIVASTPCSDPVSVEGLMPSRALP